MEKILHIDCNDKEAVAHKKILLRIIEGEQHTTLISSKLKSCLKKYGAVRYVTVSLNDLILPDGSFSDKSAEYYIERAKGGVGLISTGTITIRIRWKSGE